MTIPKRLIALLLAVALAGAACNGGDDEATTTSAEQATAAAADPADETADSTSSSDPEPDSEIVSEPEADPDAVVDGDMCAATKRLIDEIAVFTGLSYGDAGAMRTSMEGLLVEMQAVAAAAPTAALQSSSAQLLDAWQPWHDAMAAVDFDFFALDPSVFELFDDGTSGPAAFEANSETVLGYAVEHCGVSQATIDAATGADNPGAGFDDDGDATLVDTGVRMEIVIDGDTLVFTDGFCGAGTDGLIVGSWTADGTTVSLIFDPSGAQDSLRTVSVEGPDGASGAQVEIEYGDGQGVFQSGRYSGSFTCE